jgi:hypothetical protein
MSALTVQAAPWQRILDDQASGKNTIDQEDTSCKYLMRVLCEEPLNK